MSQYIIDRPDLQSFQQRYGQGVITLLFWVLFFFFMRPMIGMVGWFFGFQLFTDVMIVKGGYHALLKLLGWYFGIILVMGIILKGWGLYNMFRYDRHEKRHRQPEPVTVQDLAQHFHLEQSVLATWQTARRVVLEHDEAGFLKQQNPGTAGTATAGVIVTGAAAPLISGGSHLSHAGPT